MCNFPFHNMTEILRKILTKELAWEDELDIVQLGLGGKVKNICTEQHQRKVGELFSMKEQLMPD